VLRRGERRDGAKSRHVGGSQPVPRITEPAKNMGVDSVDTASSTSSSPTTMQAEPK